MSIIEIIRFRIPQFIQIHVLGHFQKRKTFNIDKISLNKDYISPHYSIDIINNLSKDFSFEYSFFDVKIDLSEVKDWRKDYKNNCTSRLQYYGKIKRQDFEEYGDIKYVSELSRFHFLPFIAFKYISKKEKEYSDFITNALLDWRLQNPYLNSIHWTSGVEIGIRSINLIYTHNILKQFDLLSIQTDKEIRTQIKNNYTYLKNHLSLYSSANNHLMAELMGLNVISSYFDFNENEAKNWRQLFFQQVNIQVNNDGVHMELCTRYHAEVTDQILIGVSFLKQAGHTIPKEVKEKLKLLFSFTAHVDYCGNETIFGDNDEGFVVNPYFDSNFSLYNSQLISSNYLYGTDYKSDGKIDLRNYLIFGCNFKNIVSVKQEGDTLFENSGYCFMYDYKTNTKVSFDCGTIGDNISAAHGHSDLFHFNLSVHGLPFIVDSGTYQYHTKEIFWRNYFRSAQAHNTISVNGKNHAKSNGRMSWINYPKVKIDRYELSKNKSYIKATTDAFIKDNVIHTREIIFDKDKKNILIKDYLYSKDRSSKEISFFLHFHPKVKVEHQKDVILLTYNKTILKINNKLFKDSTLIIGDKTKPLGWFSKCFNVKEKATTLNLSFSLKNKFEFETIFSYSE